MRKPLTIAQMATQTKLAREARKRGYENGIWCQFGLNKRERPLKTGVFTYNPELKINGTDTTEVLTMGINIIWNKALGWAPIIERERKKVKENTEEYLSKVSNF
ncbi:hypothetical protein ACFFVB_18305 [Formosa undariae]|uniref:Uncharacterized protein n=1 Tax=Formosa undariae TaxID=1325436 RepID=A0ABV5F6P6_9FLAO